MKFSKPSLILIALFAIISSICIERIYSIANYSILDASAKITSIKATDKFVSIMGAEEFMETSYSLHKGRINLHMWHGNQHLRINYKANLALVLNQSPGAVTDLIVSGNIIRIRRGKKISIYPYGNELKSPRESLVVPMEKSRISILAGKVFIEGVEILNINSIGFLDVRHRGNINSSIENLEIDGEAVSLRPSISMIIFSVLLISILIVLFLLGPLRGATAGICFSLISSLSLSLYLLHFQGNYSFEYLDGEKEDIRLIKKEKKRVRSQLSKVETPILFIGSSQTFGEGASSEASRWTNLYCQRLEIKNCLNIGIRSAVSATFVDLLGDINKARPEKIFFILSYNDNDPKAHKKNTETMLKSWLAEGIKVILVLEPNEYSLNNLSPLHYNLFSLSRKYGVTVVNPLEELSKRNSTGFLWWDEVHLTDYGHEVMANILISY